ncbi:hypothetical protein GCM10028801_26760 [Nocardioides maradonensis]
MTATAYPTLSALTGFPFPVFVSPGSEERGRSIASRAARALAWLGHVTDKTPHLDLVVADERDWPRVCEIPVYGVPFSLPGKIGTSTTPAAWWQEYVETLRPHLTEVASARLARTFGDPPEFTGIADLLVTHEATHLCHEIDPVTGGSEFPSLWLAELFANLGMHGYLASHEPDQLTLLAAMAAATLDAGYEVWRVTDLELMGPSIEMAGVTNYVWYEFRLIHLAGQLWDAVGTSSLRSFHQLLGHPELTPEQVVERLSRLEPAVAGAIRRWPAI